MITAGAGSGGNVTCDAYDGAAGGVLTSEGPRFFYTNM